MTFPRYPRIAIKNDCFTYTNKNTNCFTHFHEKLTQATLLYFSDELVTCNDDRGWKTFHKTIGCVPLRTL